jgi:hypothetical protein
MNKPKYNKDKHENKYKIREQSREKFKSDGSNDVNRNLSEFKTSKVELDILISKNEEQDSKSESMIVDLDFICEQLEEIT